MRITNVDTFSALLDRLTTEHVKLQSFQILGETEKIPHQQEIIDYIRSEMIALLSHISSSGKYEYLKEQRTIKGGLIDLTEKVIWSDLQMMEPEKCRTYYLQRNKVDLISTLKNDLWLRLSNEYRSEVKNELDAGLKEFTENPLASVIDTGFAIGVAQVRGEVESLMFELENTGPHENFLEIGTKLGGNFYMLGNVCTGKKISIDMPGGIHGGWILNDHPYLGDIMKARNEFFNQFKDTHMIIGDSHKDETAAKVQEILDGEKLSLLYIDGDHTYEGAKRDFELYSPLVKDGGLIIFHDIVDSPHHREMNVGVPQLWKELTTSPKSIYHSYTTIGENWAGIGVLRWKV